MFISKSLFVVDPDNKNNKRIFLSFKNASYGEWRIKVNPDQNKMTTIVTCSVPNILNGTSNKQISIRKVKQNFRSSNGRVCFSSKMYDANIPENNNIVLINKLHRICEVSSLYYKRTLVGVTMKFHREYYEGKSSKGRRKRKHKLGTPSMFYPPSKLIRR